MSDKKSEETKFKASRKQAVLISILVMALFSVAVFGYKSTKDVEKKEHPQAQLQRHGYYGWSQEKIDRVKQEKF